VVPRSASVGVLALVAAIAGFALIGFQGLMITMLVEAAGAERAGAATGFAVTFTSIAVAASPPFYGLVADTAGTYRAVWAALACVLVVALIPASLVRER